ncbi:helix-turn-helix transcriptional regulator [Paenibacillus sp. GCM10012307]|nr:AraC family transcriptional regulator [Paenibacillus roseus]
MNGPQQSEMMELLLVQGGRGTIRFDQQAIPIKEGYLAVYQPGILHIEQSACHYPLKGISLLIGNLRLQYTTLNIQMAMAGHPVIYLHHQNYDILSRYFTEIHFEHQTPGIGSSELISFLLQSIIIHLTRIISTPPKTNGISVISRTARDYIKENYARDLTLGAIASLVFVSPYYLAHIFKAEIGMSPIQYVIKCRIDAAKRMLADTRLSVSEIACLVGYSNANYFNILFKKITGETPGKFRKA